LEQRPQTHGLANRAGGILFLRTFELHRCLGTRARIITKRHTGTAVPEVAPGNFRNTNTFAILRRRIKTLSGRHQSATEPWSGARTGSCSRLAKTLAGSAVNETERPIERARDPPVSAGMPGRDRRS